MRIYLTGDLPEGMNMDRKEIAKQLRDEAKRLTMAADLLETEEPVSENPFGEEVTGRNPFESPAPKPAPMPTQPHRKPLSPETKRKMAEAQQRRWAALKKGNNRK